MEDQDAIDKTKMQKKRKQGQVTQENAGLSKHAGVGFKKPHSFWRSVL